MTLLALDLKVPDVGSHPSDAALRHALADNSSAYLSFLVSFYAVATYWIRHRRLMRSVVVWHTALVRDTIVLLLMITMMPFAASLLGSYGGTPIALAVYGVVNALAVAALMRLGTDVRQLGLVAPNTRQATGYQHRWEGWLNLAVYLLCIPAGYVLGRQGPWVLVLLAVPARISLGRSLFRRFRGSRPD
jgi:uncharacterized membrane protein